MAGIAIWASPNSSDTRLLYLDKALGTKKPLCLSERSVFETRGVVEKTAQMAP